METDIANTIAGLWVLTSAVGVGLSITNLLEAVSERNALIELGRNGNARIWATSTVLQEAVRCVGFLVATGMGIAVLVDRVPVGWVPAGLVVFLAMATINTGLTRWTLRRIERWEAPTGGRTEA